MEPVYLISVVLWIVDGTLVEAAGFLAVGLE
jgi:hypothetical protein